MESPSPPSYAVTEEEELDEDNSTGDDAENDFVETEAECEGAVTEALGGRKRRKKKKKKRKPTPGSGPNVSSALPSAALKQEMESRFASALEQLQRDAPDSAWTRLDNCNIFDAKTRKVAAALRLNKHLTSLDLSGNNIGDAGAQALAAALKVGAAPELIFLDLRNNSFGDEANQELEAVQSERRKLSIQFGAFIKATEVSPVKNGIRGKGSRHKRSNSTGNWADPDGEEMLEVQNTLRGNAANGPSNGYLDQFFQVGNGGHTMDLAEPSSITLEDPEKTSQEIWQALDALVPSEEPDIHQISHVLRACLAGISKEMAASSVPLLSNTKLPELQPFTRQAVLKLDLLGKALSIKPPSSFLTPHSKAEPPAGVGSHRAAVAQIVERLSFGRLATINTHLVKAGLLPRLFALALAFPNNNILQAACSNAMRWALESRLHLLWQPLLNPGLGLANGLIPHSQARQSSLVSEVMAVLGAAQKAPTRALRECNVGFALSLARQLHEKAETDDLLSKSLQETEGWSDFASSGGELEYLLAEQQGDLCGPRPLRSGLLESSDIATASDEDSDAPELVSGTELVKLLTQSVHGVHIDDTGTVSSDDDSDDDDDEPGVEIEPQAVEIEPQPDALQRLIETPVDIGSPTAN